MRATETAGGGVAPAAALRSRGQSEVVTVARRAWAALGPLWVAGLLALCLLAGHALLRGPLALAPGKTYDWAQYLVVGAVFPALLVGGVLAARRWPSLGRVADAARGALVALLLVAIAALAVAAPNPGVVGLAAAQLGLTALAARRAGERMDAGRALAAAVVVLVAWALAVHFVWWAPWQQAVLGRGPLAALAGLAALALTVWYVRPARFDALRPALVAHGRGVRLLGDVAAVVVIVAAAVLPIAPFGEVEAHHWGVYVGAAEMVRQGGWIFWDVPSQYGFLSILAIAAFPTDTAWQAMLVLNTAAMILTACALFLLLRAVRPGPIGWLVALGSAVFAVFFAFGVEALEVLYAQDAFLMPWYWYPSHGPYRFGWCYLLLGVLFWLWRTDERSPRYGKLLAAGCLAWALGVLWSVESAFYCSAAWLPAYALLVWRHAAPTPRRARRTLVWFALPFALLAALVGAIVVVYRAGLGHGPDWRGYVEYAVSFGGGFVGLELRPLSPVLPLLLGLALVATAAVPAVLGRLSPRSFALLVGTWGALSAASSYYVARGYSIVAGTVLPLLLAALGIVLLMLRDRRPSDAWAVIVRSAAAPLLALPLALFLGILVSESGARGMIAGPRDLLTHGGSVAPLLLAADPDLQALFDEAGLTADDPIAFAGEELAYLQPVWTPADDRESRVVESRAWLPATPFTLVVPLPDERKAVYTERFVDRWRASGWLVRRNDTGDPAVTPKVLGMGPWLFEALERTHVPTRILERGPWQMVWYEYVGEDSTALRPPPEAMTVPALPPSLRIDGTPQRKSAPQPFWAVYGPGWASMDDDAGGVWMESGARLWIYSPHDETIRLRLKPQWIGDAAGLRLIQSPPRSRPFAFDGRATRTLALEKREPVEAALGLRAGWNRVSFIVETGDGSRAAADDPTVGLIVSRVDIERGGAGQISDR